MYSDCKHSLLLIGPASLVDNLLNGVHYLHTTLFDIPHLQHWVSFYFFFPSEREFGALFTTTATTTATTTTTFLLDTKTDFTSLLGVVRRITGAEIQDPPGRRDGRGGSFQTPSPAAVLCCACFGARAGWGAMLCW